MSIEKYVSLSPKIWTMRELCQSGQPVGKERRNRESEQNQEAYKAKGKLSLTSSKLAAGKDATIG